VGAAFHRVAAAVDPGGHQGGPSLVPARTLGRD
jgi:hypothetical protein